MGTVEYEYDADLLDKAVEIAKGGGTLEQKVRWILDLAFEGEDDDEPCPDCPDCHCDCCLHVPGCRPMCRKGG